jgi:hypothetical protein
MKEKFRGGQVDFLKGGDTKNIVDVSLRNAKIDRLN